MTDEKAKLNSDLVTRLVHAVQTVVKSDNARIRATEAVTAKTEELILVAIEIGSLDGWDQYRAEIDRLARIDKRRAKSMGYEEVERERGKTTVIDWQPRQALKNIFSVIRQSFVHSVSLHVAGKPRSFNAIKTDKTKAAEKAKLKNMTPRDKELARLREVFQACVTNAKALSDEELHNALERIKAEVMPMFPPASEKKAA